MMSQSVILKREHKKLGTRKQRNRLVEQESYCVCLRFGEEYPCAGYLQYDKKVELPIKFERSPLLNHKINQRMFQSLIAVLLIVIATCGTVQMYNGTQLTFDPTSGSLSSSYNTVNPYGMPIIWNRKRPAGSYNLFAETYQRNGESNCKIVCGPFAYPVIHNGALFCKRETSNYSFSTEDYCVPNIQITGQISFACNLATYGNILYLTAGFCQINQVLNNPSYPNPATDYSCCFSNSQPTQAELDIQAVIL